MPSERPVREAENRLERFNSDRESLLAEVERRVVARIVATAANPGADRDESKSLEYVLNDVAFNEIKRLEAKHGKNGAVDRWRDLSRRLIGMSDDEKAAELRGVTLSGVW